MSCKTKVSCGVLSTEKTKATRPLVEVRGLAKHFPVREGLFQRVKKVVRAVDGVDFDIPSHETLALVGESGSGKTTIGRLIMGLIEPTAGEVYFNDEPLFLALKREKQLLRREIQMVFQGTLESLNPRQTVGTILGHVLRHHGLVSGREEIRSSVESILSRVGLDPPDLFVTRFPHELSGGQRQRVVFARAIAVSPKLIVADEPVSALDVSLRGQVLNVMEHLRINMGLTFLLISHDLSVVRSMAHRVAVMYLGNIVENAPADSLFDLPLHPYTQALLDASPVPDPRRARNRRRQLLQGELPSPVNPPPGCIFHTRCPVAEPRCKESKPALREEKPGHEVACHLVV